MRTRISAQFASPDAQDHAMKSHQIPADKQRKRLNRVAAAALLALASVAAAAADATPAAAPPAAKAAPRQHATFATPEVGFAALIQALRSDDRKALARLLGPGSERVVDSGDAAADLEARRKFVAAYDAEHQIHLKDKTTAVLSVGDDDWPMPIPMIKHGGGWSFDAKAGANELVARRIGHNELDAIQVCEAFVDMQREYAEVDRDGDGLLEYSDRLVSSPGKHDGLYWPTKPGEALSPAGPRLAEASPQRLATSAAVTPYHGYYFRVLTAQGPHAPGGAGEYRVGGQLIGGVALIAWPASYLSSGVKTFMCGMSGIVFERDFGPQTAAKVAKINAYDPGPGWMPVKW